MLDTLLLALGLVLVIEGLMPLIAPRQWRGLFRQITELADGQLRFIGLISVVAGFLVILLLN
ncbi:hypothetical protein GALL_403280 [mine drainage metagenome]|jgi:uncharacterized protein YjeT (DUF2065 family)|uniref:DUF2065 domain-containing protein n=1 Tax=mine drainage metagenome TaxID=410659 RepID=A0A1J5Q2N1_9ZZZZ